MGILQFLWKTDSQLWLMRERELSLLKQNRRWEEKRMVLTRELRINADGIGVDNSDQPDDARAPEPHEKLPTSGADDPEDVGRQTEELTVKVAPETDYSAHGRPSRLRKPPSWYGTWVAGYSDCSSDVTLTFDAQGLVDIKKRFYKNCGLEMFEDIIEQSW